MQFKEALKLYGNEVAVIPPWAYVTKTNKNLHSVRERDVCKVTFVDNKAYEPRRNFYQPSEVTGAYPDVFAPAMEDTRVKALLFQDENGNRFTLKASEVIGLWSDLEVKFAQSRTEAEKAEAEQTRTRALQNEAEERLRNTVEPMRDSIIKSVKALSGYEGTERIVVADSIRVVGEWDDVATKTAYKARLGGFVQIEVEVLQQLLEDFFDAREALAELREEVDA